MTTEEKVLIQAFERITELEEHVELLQVKMAAVCFALELEIEEVMDEHEWAEGIEQGAAN